MDDRVTGQDVAATVGGQPMNGTSESTRPIPRATYRIQFNKDFGFRQAAELVPYLARLGISHLYASPYLKARPGSTHGYDIIDHNALNPELGTEEDYQVMVKALQDHGLSQILDVVPNHMGVMGADNQWWLDVLENGPASQYADFFDIDWSPLKNELKNKVLLPVLGKPYGDALEAGELELSFDELNGSFAIRYFEHLFPIDPVSYAAILKLREAEQATEIGAQTLPEFQSLISALAKLPPRSARKKEALEERARDKDILKRRLAFLWGVDDGVQGYIKSSLEACAVVAQPLQESVLHRLLEDQAYRLAHWRTASEEVNYRRFFDINDLAGIRMERPEVFEATHRLILKLVADGALSGLRIDHPDGMYDPAKYFTNLQEAVATLEAGPDGARRQVYLVVEKILAPYEGLHRDWPVDGTTGYVFLNVLNGLFIEMRTIAALSRFYDRFTGRSNVFEETLYESKKLIMATTLASELAVLTNLLGRLSEAHPKTRDLTLGSLYHALMEVVACFPVYRTYRDVQGLGETDRRYVEWALAQGQKRNPNIERSVFAFLRQVLLLELPEAVGRRQVELLHFIMKFQQFTGPVMAKGLEDTASYNHHVLVSANEVGGDPGRLGLSVRAFHRRNSERLKFWPHEMLATTTHDTKRSEDVRARINVISEMPRLWQSRVRRWEKLNAMRKVEVDEESLPERNTEYLLYQTLIGTWPFFGDSQDADRGTYAQRLVDYMLKAVREAKGRTSWVRPDEAYEKAVEQFVRAVVTPRRTEGRDPFLDDFLPFAEMVATLGLYNTLSQVVLKYTVPGVPDLYQGTELMTLTLVDPDNRSPVDYDRRMAMLDELEYHGQQETFSPQTWLNLVEADRLKMYITARLLGVRSTHAMLFQEGEYHPVEAHGLWRDHVTAYARVHGKTVILVVAGRLYHRLTNGAQSLPLGTAWQNTHLQLPWKAASWTDLLSSRHHDGAQQKLPLAEVCAELPVAVLQATIDPS